MSALTLTKTPVLPVLDRPDADQIADEILLESAANTKTAKVHGATRGFGQSADSRAWTSMGKVD